MAPITRSSKRNSSLAKEVQQNPEKPILSSLESHVTELSSNWQNSAADAGGSVPQNPPTQVANRKEFEGGRVGPKTIVKDSHVVARGGSAKMRLSNRAVVPENQVQPNAAANVEVLSQDSGLRGCWFRCKTLRSVQNYLKVQYYHVDDAEGPGKLEEWVPATRVAEPDNLGVRCGGRLTVRPWPEWDSAELRFQVGAAVDAWWCDGWWEGVIIGCNPSARSDFQVYFPAENKFLTIQRTNLRASKDWIGNQWVAIRSKPDILSYLSSLINPTPRFPAPQPSNSNPWKKSKIGGSQEGVRQLTGSSSSASEKAGEELNLKQLLQLKEKEVWTPKNVTGS